MSDVRTSKERSLLLCRAMGWLAAPDGESAKSTRELIERLVVDVHAHVSETLPASSEKLLMQARGLLRQSLCSECGGRGWESGTRGCDWCKERAEVIERLAGAASETCEQLDLDWLRAQAKYGSRGDDKRAATQLLKALERRELKASEPPGEQQTLRGPGGKLVGQDP